MPPHPFYRPAPPRSPFPQPRHPSQQPSQLTQQGETPYEHVKRLTDRYRTVVEGDPSLARNTLEELDLIGRRRVELLSNVYVNIGSGDVTWPQALIFALRGLIGNPKDHNLQRALDSYIDAFHNAFSEKFGPTARNPRQIEILEYWISRIPETDSSLIRHLRRALRLLTQQEVTTLLFYDNSTGEISVFDEIIANLKEIAREVYQNSLEDAEARVGTIGRRCERYLAEGKWRSIWESSRNAPRQSSQWTPTNRHHHDTRR